jgi:hypothetical protein
VVTLAVPQLAAVPAVTFAEGRAPRRYP